MKDVDTLYDELSEKGIMFFNYANVQHPAVSVECDNRQAIFVNERMVNTTAEEKAVVAHEAGHLLTGSLHHVGASWAVVARDEYHAWKFAVHQMISPEDIKKAAQEGDTEIWQMAERFDLPEDFIRRAVYIYQCEGKL